MPEATTAAAAEPNPPAPRKSGSKLKWLLALVLCSVVAAVGAWFVASKHAATSVAARRTAAAAKARTEHPLPMFVSLGDPLVVNLTGDSGFQFMQIDARLVTHDAAIAPAVKQLEPDIRNRLLLLFSAQHASDLMAPGGKQRLQAQALKQVQAVLAEFHQPTDIRAVIFTSFVMQ
ncbi:MAG: flagellar basal body-associated FliL family protein [Rhodanobacteraceae bacterium]